MVLVRVRERVSNSDQELPVAVEMGCGYSCGCRKAGQQEGAGMAVQTELSRRDGM